MSEHEKQKPALRARRDFLKHSFLGASGLAATAALSGCSNSPEPTPAPTPAGSTQIPSAAAWKFGIMADSQWYQPDDGKDLFSVAQDIRNQVMQEMINNGAKFVAHVGDLTSNGAETPIDIYGHALFVQTLYNAGIGYLTMRGNHEDSAAAAPYLQSAFPHHRTIPPLRTLPSTCRSTSGTSPPRRRSTSPSARRSGTARPAASSPSPTADRSAS